MASTVSTRSTDHRSARESTVSVIGFSRHEIKDYASRDQNARRKNAADQENVRLELRLPIAGASGDHAGNTPGAVRVFRQTSPATIDASQSGRYSTFGDEPMTRSVSLSSPSSIALPSDGFPMSGIPGRSPGAVTTPTQNPGDPEATLGALTRREITTSPSARTHRTEASRKVGAQRGGGGSTELEADGSIPLNSAIGVKGVEGAVASSPVPKSAGVVGGLVRVVTSLNSHERDPMNAVKADKDGEEEAGLPKDSSDDRIIARSISDDLDSVRTAKRLSTDESPARGLGLTLAQEEALDLSSWRFDVPPLESQRLTNDRRSPDGEIGETHSTLSDYDGRPIEWLTPDQERLTGTTLPTTAVGFPRRHMRDVPESVVCHKFVVGEPDKREFYSPYYPQNYPPLANCVRVLEGEWKAFVESIRIWKKIISSNRIGFVLAPIEFVFRIWA